MRSGGYLSHQQVKDLCGVFDLGSGGGLPTLSAASMVTLEMYKELHFLFLKEKIFTKINASSIYLRRSFRISESNYAY